jgi:uncharacterized protein (TIGR02246 family)
MRMLKHGVAPLAVVATLTLPIGVTARAGQDANRAGKATQTSADSELSKVADDYSAGWRKGDAAAVAALYTTDAVYIDSGGVLMKGRSEIEATLKERFAGELKGTTLTISAGETRQIAPQVRIAEGAWMISGLPTGEGTVQPRATAATPTAGRYLNTFVRVEGRWMIAGTAAVPEPPKEP